MTEHQPQLSGGPEIDGMPALGLGTWQNEDHEQCAESVATALETGYRHVDTAQIYGNEAAVGDGIQRADVPREEIFLATKVWRDNLAYDDVIESTEQSLEKLGVDRVDLLYVHWPSEPYDPEDTLSAFAELRERGLTDEIGVSNFTPELLDEAIDACGAPIAAHQFECHPFLPQHELVEHTQERDVTVVGYSPLARGRVLDHPVIEEIASDHGASAAQVSLAWLRERGVVTTPKATAGAHVRDNWGSLGVDLTDDEIERLDAIAPMGERERCVDPSFGPW